MPEGKPIPLNFPLNGIDVVREFQLQPPGTTADALNVRSRDAIARRNRGGSRPGFSKYIAQQIPEGAKTIQHLNYIVDPTTAALPQNFVTPLPDWIPDPRFGLPVPPGGAPWQPTPNAGQDESLIQFRQLKQITGGTALIKTGTFPAAVALDQYVFIAVFMGGTAAEGTAEPNFTLDVENGNNDNFTQIGGYVSFYFAGDAEHAASYNRQSLWYRKVAHVTNDRSMEVNFLQDWTADTDWTSSAGAFGLCYSGVKLSAPIADNDSTIGSPNASCTTGNLTVSADESMVLGVFFGVSSAPFIPTPAGSRRTSQFFADELGFAIYDRRGLAILGSPYAISTGHFANDGIGRGTVIGVSVLPEPP